MMTPSASTSKLSPALSNKDLEDTTSLLESLYSFGKNPDDDRKLAKLLRHTDHHVLGNGKKADHSVSEEGDGNQEDSYKITSWKMQDYAYKRDPCPYPTRARGLFTAGTERIVARAYDKFFNVDEVSWTKWTKLPELTASPYYLTLKSNGCLILIAALSPSELLITSKHAIGQAKQENAVSHAEMGERWLDRGLKKVGKTREELAARLWKENWTCVAELCDDSFEEHILPYSSEMSGLHLHGLVFNHPTLLTLPPPEVNKIASEYGFLETAYTVLSSVDEVRQFSRDVAANDGQWNGTHVEGFVVRAALRPGSLEKQPQPNDLNEENWQDIRRVFMWKIKFDQPYLMWREWREVTKRMLTEKRKNGDDVAAKGRRILNKDSQNGDEHTKQSTNGADQKGKRRMIEEEEEVDDQDKTANGTLPTSVRADKIRNPETRLYAIWVEKYMQSNPEAFAEYQDNRGILAVREAFLKWRYETDEGKEMEEKILGGEKKKGGKNHKEGDDKSSDSSERFDKTLIVPIAVPGCGKTLIGVALAHLFGFAHTQSDDIKEKKAAKHFESTVARLLDTNDVVFADKNNHLKQHRQAMAEIASKSKSKVRLIAIIWPLTNLPQNEIHRICSDRIVGRGENHQSLRPLETGEHEIILMRFFSQTEPFDMAFNASSDAHFHNSIEMDISWEFKTALEYIIEQLIEIGDIHGVVGKPRPTAEQIDEAILVTQGYKPSIIKEMNLQGLDPSAKNGGKSKGARYYGIAVEVDLPSLLEKYFKEHDVDENISFFKKLKDTNRIEKRPHVTLIHEKELEMPEDGSRTIEEVDFCKDLWEKCRVASSKWGTETVEVTLTLGPVLVWDERAMSIQVSRVEYVGNNVKKEDLPSDQRKESYHITVGTLNQEVRPIEGKSLLESALKGEETSRAGKKMTTIQMDSIEVKGRIRGLF